MTERLSENPSFQSEASPVLHTPTLAQITRMVLLAVSITAFCYFARAFVLPVLLAWVGAMALKPPVSWLRARHFPAPLAAGMVVAIAVFTIAAGMYYLGRPAAAWIQSSPQALPQLKQKYENFFRPFARFNAITSGPAITNAAAGATTQTNTPAAIAPADVSPPPHMVSTVFNWTGSLLAGIGETIALLFLLLASGDLFMQKLVRVMPTWHDKKRAVEMSHEIQQNISRYLFSISLINLGLGTIIGTALHFLGMPAAWMWGAVAAMANFVPYFGPVVGMIAVGIAGLLAFDNVGSGLAPAGVYLLVHLIEANLVTPYALGKRFTLNPVIIFVFLIFCVWLWGVIGAFLAVPILVTLKVVCDRVERFAAVGEFLSS